MRTLIQQSLFVLGSIIFSCNALTHPEAKSQLDNAGIALHSTASCIDKRNKLCTSLDGIRQETINLLISLKAAAPRCRFIVNGGTEVGHGPSGINTHANGYKVDVRLNWCINNFIENGAKTKENPNFRHVGNIELSYPGNRRKYMASLYRSISGAFLLKKYNRWDILYPHNPVPNWQ